MRTLRLRGLSGLKRPSIPLFPWFIGFFALLGYLVNYWVSDDGIILWRTVEQFHAGHGPVFNEGWRVQVYTSPLWYWVLVAGRYFSSDLYLVTFAISTMLYTVLLVFMWATVRTWQLYTVAILWFMVSVAFDFTASGLENGLGFVFVAAFLFHYLRNDGRNPGLCIVLAGWALLVRADLVFLFACPAIYLWWQNRGIYPVRKWLGIIALAIGPFAVWECFSLVYYGSLVPNTYYAKAADGIARLEYILMGVDYLKHNLMLDPVHAISLLAATVIGLIRPARDKVLALGIVLNVLYAVWVGGDFMVARFFSYAFLGTVITVTFYISRSR